MPPNDARQARRATRSLPARPPPRPARPAHSTAVACGWDSWTKRATHDCTFELCNAPGPARLEEIGDVPPFGAQHHSLPICLDGRRWQRATWTAGQGGSGAACWRTIACSMAECRATWAPPQAVTVGLGVFDCFIATMSSVEFSMPAYAQLMRHPGRAGRFPAQAARAKRGMTDERREGTRTG